MPTARDIVLLPQSSLGIGLTLPFRSFTICSMLSFLSLNLRLVVLGLWDILSRFSAHPRIFAPYRVRSCRTFML